jgi:hypothetical protein
VLGDPVPPGRLVDVGGQRLHVHCTGPATGAPTVLLESGAGDVSVIWALVQPRVAAFARVCSYDRGGYAWSDPGARPRSYAQLALELHRVRWSAASAPRSGDRPYVTPATHHARHRNGAPRREWIGCAHCADCGTVRRQLGAPLEAPLDRLPADAQRVWWWATSRPMIELAQGAEMDWSPEELARLHVERRADRATLSRTRRSSWERSAKSSTRRSGCLTERLARPDAGQFIHRRWKTSRVSWPLPNASGNR